MSVNASDHRHYRLLSGAGTTSVMRTFTHMFRREHVNARSSKATASIATTARHARGGCRKPSSDGALTFQPFRPRSESVQDLERLFAELRGNAAAASRRRYLHDDAEAQPLQAGSGHVHGVGRHAARHRPAVTTKACTARSSPKKWISRRHADLLIGVVPIINLEWIQKLHRDRSMRGYSTKPCRYDAAAHARLRALHLPAVFAHACELPARADRRHIESVHRARIPQRGRELRRDPVRHPKGIDFPYLLSMLHDSFMSRANMIVVPGGKMELAMQLIFTPMILQLRDRSAQGMNRFSTHGKEASR